ncbi:FBP domain-containing protein [Kineococcus sp. NPDC059986]|uniref:FBP domain-containing protein n=1 Tax=Kineococcus sp. NPDC059986 TaxID=3155538 RepID=UPI003450BB6D
MSPATLDLTDGHLTDEAIRSTMTNCSRGEAHRMRVPDWVHDCDPVHEVVGWRDPKAPERGWLLVPLGEAVVGLALRATPGTGVRTTAMCDLCRTTRSPGEVSLFVAARAGESGRKHNTVGTYLCSDLACADNVRVLRATPTLKPDPGLSISQRRDALRERAAAFAAKVLASRD